MKLSLKVQQLIAISVLIEELGAKYYGLNDTVEPIETAPMDLETALYREIVWLTGRYPLLAMEIDHRVSWMGTDEILENLRKTCELIGCDFDEGLARVQIEEGGVA